MEFLVNFKTPLSAYILFSQVVKTLECDNRRGMQAMKLSAANAAMAVGALPFKKALALIPLPMTKMPLNMDKKEYKYP